MVSGLGVPLAERTLEFRRPFDRGWASVPLDQLSEVWRLDRDDTWNYELVFRDDSRVLVDMQVFGDFDDFRHTLSEVRPGIRYDRRLEAVCPGCGRDVSGGDCNRAVYLAFVTHRCDVCGAHVARRLKRIPAGGIVLPDAVRS